MKGQRKLTQHPIKDITENRGGKKKGSARIMYDICPRNQYERTKKANTT